MELKRVLPGATLGIVSPASPVPPEILAKGLARLHELGFRTKVMPHAAGSWRHFSGTDAQRAADISLAFEDEEVDAVLCSRGGYGSARLLPLLDLNRVASTGKPFLGFSDVTSLHLALNHRGLPTLHAPMVYTLASERPKWVTDSLVNALGGDYRVPGEAPAGTSVVGGRARGIVTGGCLTLLADSLGTPEALVGKGKLVLIEDVGEQPHRVDASLTHLLNSGALDGVAGFVIGELTDTDSKSRPEDSDWRSILTERLEPLGVPIIFDYPFGHIGAMLTLPLGVEALLDADQGTLTYLEG